MAEDGTGAARFAIRGEAIVAPPVAAGLYVVSTPIGNLGDITIRALETLAGVDLVLCEDTRHSARLLDHYGIRTRRRALHEHNERDAAQSIVAQLAGGARMALISDAGTPLLSDPGFPLVRAVREAGLPVFAVPGPSALLAAVAVAGLPTDSFSFFGFLPTKAAARQTALGALASRHETLVFYESPRRLAATLGALGEMFGPEREAAVGLELTKRFERVARGTIAALAERFAGEETKGEAVILVAGAPEAPAISEDEWQGVLSGLLQEMSLREAVDTVSDRFALPRREVYRAALAQKA